MLPKNLQIKKDFEAGIIKHKGYHNTLIVLGLVIFITLAFAFKYVSILIESPYNLGTIWWAWGFVGAFIAQRVAKDWSTTDWILSFPLYFAGILAAYPIDFLYRTFKRK